MRQVLDMATKLAEDVSAFTFKPKVSPNSTKITQSLGTDFASRQRLHLEKQRQHIEQASLHFTKDLNSFDSVSSVEKNKKLLKEKANKQVRENEEKENIHPDLKPDTGQGRPIVEQLDNLPPGGATVNGSRSSPNLNTTKESPTKSRSSLQLSAMDNEEDNVAPGDPIHIGHSRSKTMPPQALSPPKKLTNINLERLKNAKQLAEKAMKNRKIFLIQGPYPAIRQSLRERGWVEKFYRMGGNPSPKKSPHKKKKQITSTSDTDEDHTDDDDDDDDDSDDDPNADDPNDHGCKIPPWEEENGLYGIMSRTVRNASPTFIWSVRRDVIDPKALKRDQMINHYGKAGSFTTKVGLCVNMRNLTWFQEANPDTYFPRCYRLSHEEEKQAFIDDYRLTSCLNLLKHVKEKLDNPPPDPEPTETDSTTPRPEVEAGKDVICTNPECTKSRPNDVQGNKCIHAIESSQSSPRKVAFTLPPIPEHVQLTADVSVLSTSSHEKVMPQGQPLRSSLNVDNSTAPVSIDKQCDIDSDGDAPLRCPLCNSPIKKKKVAYVPLRAVEVSLLQCEKYLRSQNHDDLDDNVDRYFMTEPEWDEFLQWYYKVIHDGAVISHTESKRKQIDLVLSKMRDKWSQYELDGSQNVWMVKAGAKSRGRGIVPYNRLEDMLKLVSAQVVKKEGKYVVQKYIERPLLVFNTKFDIRQWFLVTDWNPLTIWFYKDSYIRFCSQEYTLNNLNEAIHLSNNAIQKNYDNGPRSKSLPAENMWTCQQFIKHIKQRGFDDTWEEVIYPGMKKAVVGALLCSQDIVEYRKSAFELYGADFMLTEDMQPWLIEVNSSPSMASTTKVTSKLCANVLSDTVKVVLDRKFDKNADTGRFELAYKQTQVTVPPYIGINLTVDGSSIKKPAWMIQRKVEHVPEPPHMSAVSPRTSTTVPATKVKGAGSTAAGATPHKPGEAATSGSSQKVFKQNYTHTDSTSKTPDSSNTQPAKVSRQTGTTKSTPSFSSKTNLQSPTKPSRTSVHRSPAKNESKDDVKSNRDDVKKEAAAAASGGKKSPSKSKRRSRSTSAKNTKETVSNSDTENNVISCQKETKSDTVLNSDDKETEQVGTAVDFNEEEHRPATDTQEEALFDHRVMDSDEEALRQALGIPTYEDDLYENRACGVGENTASAPNMRTLSQPTYLPKPTLRRSTEPKHSLLAPSTQNHVEFTEQQKLFEKSSSEKLLLPLKSAETVDIQAMHYDVSSKGNKAGCAGYVMSSPLLDSQWGRTCNRCGNGMNLKLDHPSTSPCQCQQDSIRMGDHQWYPTPSSVSRGNNPGHSGSSAPLATNTNTSLSQPPAPRAFAPHPPAHPPSPALPKRIHIDKNKLVSSVYSKAQTCQLGINHSRSGNKFVLKYTDANIQKPDSIPSKTATSTGFPKLVSKYIGRKGTKDGLPVCIETYKQSKLTIVTQSFH